MTPLKRLVICCDGTWKNSDDKNVSNIERIARSIQTSPPGRVGGRDVVQIVHYSSGVGTGATKSDKLLGGALGLGLDAAILGAYRFLALNYEPGDEIFVFGFSRGAFTARSLVGMIGSIGLLNPMGVVEGGLATAMRLYRTRPRGESTAEMDAFREELCFPRTDVGITFLGVFDTVGALGVPGLSRSKYRFHDVGLSDQVITARQALAIDERRLAFAPCVWDTRGRAVPPTHSVRQVWFEGVHSDVGGGYAEAEAGLSALSLNWMVREAEKHGLVFCRDRVLAGIHTEPLEVHNSLKPMYRIANLLASIRIRLGFGSDVERDFVSGRRRLAIDPSEYLADSAYERWNDDVDGRGSTAPNIAPWPGSTNPPPQRIEKLPLLDVSQRLPSISSPHHKVG